MNDNEIKLHDENNLKCSDGCKHWLDISDEDTDLRIFYCETCNGGSNWEKP